MDCTTATLDEIKDRFASDWGFGREVTDTFSETVLRRACASGQPYIYIDALLHFRNHEAQNKNITKSGIK